MHRVGNVRPVRKPRLKEIIDSNKGTQSLIYRATYLYNLLPDIFRTYNTKKFKKHVTQHILDNFQNNNIPKNVNY